MDPTNTALKSTTPFLHSPLQKTQEKREKNVDLLFEGCIYVIVLSEYLSCLILWRFCVNKISEKYRQVISVRNFLLDLIIVHEDQTW